MFPSARWFLVWLAATVGAVLRGESFTIVAYNVENLMDVDGQAVYDDFQPANYTPAHLRTKLANIATVLAKFGRGQGPAIILFQEIEYDLSRDSRVGDYEAFLKKYQDSSFESLLSQSPLSSELAGLPAEAWLLKALTDRGLSGYHVIVGDQGEDGPSRETAPAIKCVIFSRYPAIAVHTHPIAQARDIVEVRFNVNGHSLYVFNNHWKSGASDAALEKVRIEDAAVLRARLNVLFEADPQADIVLGGDFNSQYNQKQRYPAMERTALNDVLRSQGNELAIRGVDRDLYNLWFELPSNKRGSDIYKGEWGTLEQMILSRGLYDQRGVQYIDNSFAVASLPGVNVDVGGLPLRWNGGGLEGSGFSDHLPVFAHFRTVETARSDRWMELVRPSTGDRAGVIPPVVDYGGIDLSAEVIDLSKIQASADLRDGSWTGKLFYVRGEVVVAKYPTVNYRGAAYEIYGSEKEIRELIYEQREKGWYDFYGELSLFKDRWQFIVRDKHWIE